MIDELFRSDDASPKVGISVITLQRRIAAGKVKAPPLCIRNGRAVRLWNADDVARLRDVKVAIYCRGRGRKKRSN